MAKTKRLTALFMALLLVFSAMFANGMFATVAAEETTAEGTEESSDSGDTNLTDSLVGYYTFDDTLANTAKETSAASENAGTGSAALHGGAGDTWNSAATGSASYSTDAVSGSAYEFSGNSNLETLSSTTLDWWGDNCDTGNDYSLVDGQTIVFTVECTADVSNYAAFSVELYDASGNYFTTGSDGNAWYAGGAADTGSVSGILSPLASTIAADTTYTVTVSRSGDNFTVKYYDTTNSTEFATLTGTSGVDFDDTVYVHLMAQVGTFFITNTSATNASGEGLELDVTTGEEFTVSMWVNTSQKQEYQPIFLTIYSGDYYVTAGTYYNQYASGGIVNYGGTWYWLDQNNNSSSSLKDLSVGTWTYVTLTMTADGVATLYYNGEVLSTQTISGYDSSYYTGMPIYLGINWWNDSFAGLMDEVTVYESALTASEVLMLYSYNGDPEAAAEAQASGETAVSISHVSVHDPSIVKGYVEESVTELTADTEIVGVADDTHTKYIYFVFGSHLAFAWSWDLCSWTTFTNNITTDYETLFVNEAAWSAKGSSSYDLSGNMWAPDVIWNESMGKWCMYMSINGDYWYSTICLLTSDSLYGDWTYVGMVAQSGLVNSAVTFDYAEVMGTTEIYDRYTQKSGGGNALYDSNCIDPCVTYDDDGNLWMTYGSWFGGIWMFQLDPDTGLRDYTVTYTTSDGDSSTTTSDQYLGYRIAGGTNVSGEASYIEKIGDYYCLFVTYGGLTAAGGYNMRVFRSTSITGPYKDESGDDARYSISSRAGTIGSTVGMRLMSYYKWSYQTYAQVAQGHNSVYYDQDTDQVYLVYHTRTNDGTEGHSVRVHQLFVNEDGWLVTAPFEYAGEKTTNASIQSTTYDVSEIAGMYEVLLQAQSIDYANLAYVEPVYIALGSDGTISGDLSGTWTVTDGTCYITLTTGTDTYKGVLLTQTVEGKTTKTITFTGVGTSTETAIWGYRFSGTEALTMEAEALTLPAQTVNGTALDLPTAGTYGTAIIWTSSDESIIATDGTVSVPATTTMVTLTAVISNDAGSVTETYEVTVLGEDATDEEGTITVWSMDGTIDLTGADYGTNSYPNYFNSEIGTAGLSVSNGVSIEFTVNLTGDYGYLSNILSFNDGSYTYNDDGYKIFTAGMYFTGGSYLGYNATGGYFDANVNYWSAAEDYIGSNEDVTIRIELYSYKYEVYVDDVLAYSNTTVDEGSTPGFNSMDSYYSVLTYLGSTATELDLGWGSWWAGAFAGTISDITLKVLDEGVDTCGYAYYADYSAGGGTLSDWTAQDSGYLAIANDGDTRANYVKYAYNTSVSGARYAYTKFSEDAQLSGQYTVSVDVQLTAGQSGSSTTSNFAIMGTDASGYTSHTTGGISSGYILKLSNNYPADSSTVWTINDDSDTTVTIPVATWVTITADVDTDAGTAAVTIIGEDDTEYFNGTVTISGSGTLEGICVLRGRGYGTVSIDNIKVYQTPTIEFLGGSLRIDTTDYDTTSLRFGYTIDLGSVDLSSIDLEDEHATTWSWEWSVDGASNSGTVEGVNYVDNGDGTITTNLVITGIPSEYYTSELYSTLTFTYCLGGETQTIVLEDSPQVRSVYEVATAIIEDTTASETAVAYAEAILDVISADGN